MCTLIVAWQVFDDAPICVAANRDESTDRPSNPPTIRDDDPRVLAPRDERAGGTWLGYNEHGVLVAITNRWVVGEGERSRGLLVDDALSKSSADEAIDHVARELERRTYEPFHLLVADESDCHLVEHGRDDRTRSLDPGVHIIVNVGIDGDWFVPTDRPDVGNRQAENATDVWAELQPREGEDATGWIARAGDVLGDHDYGVCLHGDGFGTRSSSLICLGGRRLFEFADGPPCQTPYKRVDETV